MNLLRVGAAALNQTPMAWRANRDHILAAIEQAKQAGVNLLCLPEMAVTGYGCDDMFQSPEVQSKALASLRLIAEEASGLVVTVGLPLCHRKAVWNTVAVLANRQIVGFVPKQHLAGDGLHYEPRQFRAWPQGVQERTPEGIPIGDYYFEADDTVDAVRFGFEVCEDAWVRDRPGIRLAGRGVDILLNPSASHFAFDKTRIRQRFVSEGSRAFGCAYVYSNLLGNEAGRIIYDGETLVASGGEIVARGARFSYEDVVLTTCVLDMDLLRSQQAKTASFFPQLGGGDGDRVHFLTDFATNRRTLKPEPLAPVRPEPWEAGEYRKEEEFLRAECLGLFDYLRKSRSHGFALSLSGGADSATCAVLIRYMVEMAGLDKCAERLSYIPAVATWAGRLKHPYDHDLAADALVRILLVTSYQPSENSGNITQEAAARVADDVGAEHCVIAVGDIVALYQSRVERAIGRGLTWTTDNVTLQNLQARVRSPSIWALANIGNRLLLTTSNRSEAAVGYATMDGDTSGGLAPLAGIDKAFIRKWLVWAEKVGPDISTRYRERRRFASLMYVNAQQPTAELCPAEFNQTDESDLMPYPILDAIEKAGIRDKRGPEVVFDLMQSQFPDVPSAKMLGHVVRFFRLWSRNQWKRERYAVAFHLDDENLDPKTWCRFPVLSGGFEEDLEDLIQRQEAAQ